MPNPAVDPRHLEHFRALLSHRLGVLQDNLIVDFRRSAAADWTPPQVTSSSFCRKPHLSPGQAATGSLSCEPKPTSQTGEEPGWDPRCLELPDGDAPAPCAFAAGLQRNGLVNLQPARTPYRASSEPRSMAKKSDRRNVSVSAGTDGRSVSVMASEGRASEGAGVRHIDGALEAQELELSKSYDQEVSLTSVSRYSDTTEGVLVSESNNTDDLPRQSTFARTASGPGALNSWSCLVTGLLEDGCFKELKNEFELSYPWSAQKSSKSAAVASILREIGDVHEVARGSLCVNVVDTDQECGLLQALVLHPNSPWRLAWVVCGTLMVAFDLITLPMSSAGLLEEPTASNLEKGALYTMAYWFLDIVFQFFTGFHTKDGYEEMRLSYIARAYLKTWFLHDVIVVSLDLMFVFEGLFPMLRVLRAARMLRMVRLLRLLRMGKAWSLVSQQLRNLRSSVLVVVCRLVEQLLCVLFMNHLVACAWYAVAALNSSTARTWITAYQAGTGSHGYIMALHWTLTQFTPATNNIAPQNTTERCFAVVVVVFALVMFSSFVSSVTNAVNQLRVLNSAMTAEGGRLRSFLMRKKVSSGLSARVLHFFNENYREMSQTRENEINLFKGFPESMMMALHRELHQDAIMTNVLFSRVQCCDEELFIVLCHSALSEVFYLARQDVFMNSADAEYVYSALSGEMRYQPRSSRAVPVEENTWLGEMGLWVKWYHTGRLSASQRSNVVRVSVIAFQQIVGKRGGPMLQVLRKYVAFLLGHIESENIRMTDLPLPDDVVRDLASRATELFGRSRLWAQAFGVLEKPGGHPARKSTEVERPKEVRRTFGFTMSIRR